MLPLHDQRGRRSAYRHHVADQDFPANKCRPFERSGSCDVEFLKGLCHCQCCSHQHFLFVEPSQVLDADLDERVEGAVIAEFPPFQQTVEWFNSEAYVQARKDRTNGNEYLGIVVESGVAPISKRSAGTPAYVVFVCREILDHEALNMIFPRKNGQG